MNLTLILILIILGLVGFIAAYIYISSKGSKKLEARIQEKETEKKILLKMAASNEHETIKSEEQLKKAKDDLNEITGGVDLNSYIDSL